MCLRVVVVVIIEAWKTDSNHPPPANLAQIVKPLYQCRAIFVWWSSFRNADPDWADFAAGCQGGLHEEAPEHCEEQDGRESCGRHHEVHPVCLVEPDRLSKKLTIFVERVTSFERDHNVAEILFSHSVRFSQQNSCSRKCKMDLTKQLAFSDESPSTCQMFLNEGGLDLFMEVLEVRKLLLTTMNIFWERNWCRKVTSTKRRNSGCYEGKDCLYLLFSWVERSGGAFSFDGCNRILQTYKDAMDDVRIQVETKVLGLIVSGLLFKFPSVVLPRSYFQLPEKATMDVFQYLKSGIQASSLWRTDREKGISETCFCNAAQEHTTLSIHRHLSPRSWK